MSGSTFCDGCRQGGFAMIDVADRPDVYVGLVSAVCLLRLRSEGSPAQRHSTLRDKEEPNNLTTAKNLCFTACSMPFHATTYQFEGAVQEAW